MALLISNAVPAGTDAPSTIDDVIRAFKIAVQDIFGIPDNTTISAAVMSVDSGGLQYLAFTDEAADAAAAGRLQRNAANLTFHDGTAARTLVNTATAQTLTTKTLTSPIVGTQITLDQTTADYTLTWADPAAARAISIPDPLGTDVFVFRDMTQTLTNKTLTAPSLGGSDMTAVDEIALNDAAADATAAGRIRRNAANLTFHDGTRAVILTSAGCLLVQSSGLGIAAGSTVYLMTMGHASGGELMAARLPFPCVLRNLYCRSNAAPGAGETYVFTVENSGVDTALTATISNPDLQAADTSNTVVFAAGDRFSVKVVTSSGAASADFGASAEILRTS